ncbi:unnamed protein product [Ceratitis capitata]|uniref:(Mediterranean fruit fly) hypothetical protein n=1 Tax=Ceratitis capitata TaxID=7213 RepID=A0A811V824_CERCA|nr:unnamed protein product [Ceratitis capitata]
MKSDAHPPTKPNQLKPKHTELQRTTLLASNASCTPANLLRPDVGLVADAIVIIALLSRLYYAQHIVRGHVHILCSSKTMHISCITSIYVYVSEPSCSVCHCVYPQNAVTFVVPQRVSKCQPLLRLTNGLTHAPLTATICKPKEQPTDFTTPLPNYAVGYIRRDDNNNNNNNNNNTNNK